MVGADVSRAVLLIPILIAPDHLPVLYTVAAIQGTIQLFFKPAEGALLPKLVGEEHLVAANAMNTLNNNFGMLLGPAMGTILYAGFGIGGTILADIGTFLVSASLIAAIRTNARPEREGGIQAEGEVWTRFLAEWRDGLGVIRRNRTLRVMFAATTMTGIAEGVFLTLGVSPLVLDVLGGTPAQVGWFGSSQAVGGLIAGVIVIRLGHYFSKRWLLGGGMAGIGLADLGSANARLFAPAGTPAVGVAMGFMIVAGPPSVAMVTGQQSLIQEQAADAYRGRVFGALGSTLGVAMMAGLAVGGVLGELVGLVGILSVAALLRVAGGISVLTLMPRGEPEPPASETTQSPEPPAV